jgi:hypothetical protein
MTLGGASVIGTGAFTSVRAERSISVDVVGDGSAFLKLQPYCSTESDTQSSGGSGDGTPPQSSDFVYNEDGAIAIDLTAIKNNDKRPIDSGAGITEDSLWRFPNAFLIKNQGTQSVSVDLQVNEGTEETYPKIDISSEKTVDVGGGSRTFNPGAPAVVFYPGTNDSEGNLFPPTSLDPGSGIELSPSHKQCIGFNVRTFGLQSDDAPFANANLVIRAEANAEAPSDPPQPGLSLDINDISINAGSLELDGTVTNNSPDPQDIDITLKIQNENVGKEVNDDGLDHVEERSDHDFEITGVDVNRLKSGTYTAVVTAIANGVAPVSDSVEFEVTSNGGAGFTFTEPTVDTFIIKEDTSISNETFQRGCGNGGSLEDYSFFHVVDSFDGDGETDRLYPHPSGKRFDEGEFEINSYCETDTGRDRSAYWIKFSQFDLTTHDL